MSFLSGLFKKKKKVVVIGLDGAPYTLMNRFIKDGTMPNLARIVKSGSIHQMDSSIPEISSVAWSSFMTGSNPGRHGIFGFVDLEPNSYKLRFPNFSSLKQPTIWDEIAHRGKKTVVINLPSTYPARQINGVLISGFVAPRIERAVYPKAIIPKLEQFGYVIDVDSSKAHKDINGFIEDLFTSLEARVKTMCYFLDKKNWDLFIGVITGTDRLHHFVWDALEQADNPHHEDFIKYYKQADNFLGDVLERIDDRHSLFVMSDHGFARVKKQIHLNYWLKENGYLMFDKHPPDSLEDISPQSKAFIVEPARLFINLEGKFPKGSVKASDYDSLRDELIDKISRLKDDDGSPIIRAAYKKEEVYDQEHIEEAADVLFVSHHGYDLKGSIKKDSFSEKSIFTGMHTQDDAFIASNRTLSFPKKPNVSDLKSIISEMI